MADLPDEPLKASWTGIPSADELQAAGIAIAERFVTALDGALNLTIADLDGWSLEMSETKITIIIPALSIKLRKS